MKKYKNAGKLSGFLALSLVLGAALAPGKAFAEKTGNGGGAWVCRERSGAIRWSQLVDLFEATDEFGLTLGEYSGSTNDIADQIQLRISKANRDLSEAVGPYLEKLGYLNPNPPKITYTDDILKTIDDSLYRLKPSPKRCVGGSVAYEQVVNYKQDGLILVQRGIFNSLSPSVQAALVFHEAIYKYRRDHAGDTNSVATRRMVGLVFSTLSAEDLKKALADLGESEINKIDMKFVSIRPGTFMMGSPASESDRDDDETRHQVTITRGFEIQVTVVTQAQWVQVMGKNPSHFQSQDNCPQNYVAKPVAMCPNHPVEYVSWNDVQDFIKTLNQTRTDGYTYRLPTEAEWEFAARAGTTTPYFYGDGTSQLSAYYCWFSENSDRQTHDVMLLNPNAFGLYDMCGNVWQWVQDWRGGFSTQAQTDPVGPPAGSLRVLRGGGWYLGARSLRSANRVSGAPGNRDDSFGFRLVRTR